MMIRNFSARLMPFNRASSLRAADRVRQPRDHASATGRRERVYFDAVPS